jgi:hypothetical protein
MKFNEYLPLAMRTNSPETGHHGQESLDFMHGAAGLVTELLELEEAEDELNAMEEAGDCAWFIALMCNAIDYDFTGRIIGKSILTHPEIGLLDIAKRWFAYGKLSDNHKSEAKFLLQYIYEKLNMQSEILEANIKKLKARYPNKFSQDDALNRDKGAEYAAMVKE